MPAYEDFVAGNYQAAPRRPLGEHPKGWEPGVVFDGTTGTIQSGAESVAVPDWTELLKKWGFDPDEFEIIDETVQVKTWEGFIKNKAGQIEKTQLWAHGAKIRRRTHSSVDVEGLRTLLRKPSKTPKVTPHGDGRALVVNFSDWQLGKGEGGGTPATFKRVMAMISAVEVRWHELVAAGRRLDTLYVLGLGDIVEGCTGFYPMQEFSVDLTRRQQANLAAELITDAVRKWAQFAPAVVVACVPGNHGENRKDGKAFTSFGDNDDVACFESVARAFKLAANYPHVSFVIPRDELAITLDIHGTIVALAHGHQARTSGTTAHAKLAKWWQGQAYGRLPVGDATILFTGHYHHLSVVQQAGRTHFQAPSLDGGSEWFTATTGQHSEPGTLTVLIGSDGWSDMAVL